MRYGSVVADFGETPGFRVWRGEPLATMPFHWHDQVEINYAVGGSLTYLLAGSLVRVPPGRLAVFWAGTPHSVVNRTQVDDFYWVYVPLAWALRLGLPNAFTRRVMSGELVVDADPLGTDPPMLSRWSEELPGADEARTRLIVREVENRLMRLALSQPGAAEDGCVPAGAGPVRKVTEMARFVAENHEGPLRLSDVARHVGLHPNYAMALFRKHYGITLSAYLTRLRVCQAQYLLLSTDHDASRIAFEAGFGSISRFYEAFKTVSGTTPGEYRLLPKLQ
ncbi:helix-turn-helix domain-containing protein [Rubrobacter tropicus]|uniref:Helix-turn-helix domain-containing protein n=1 Tax=Rubrobacter tropicus TaxID=2653851 RepID=A0A6G8QAI8_9ACTN|nr:helix-turn-helix domain-containing protein [Rubrobacter tropicus]QIN83486.1 helix-turn-helix domain-containing protein [Rubrobacter tropicus]